MPIVSYGHAGTAMPSLDAEVHRRLQAGAKRVCDVGGGANPVTPLADIRRLGLDYVILDAAEEELGKSAPGYSALAVDITDRDAVQRLVSARGPFDLVISRWTAEHVTRGQSFHGQIHRLLRPGGTAVHLFPTLYSPVFVANRVLPHSWRAVVLPMIDRSGRERGGAHQSFRPYYSWCRGPTRRQLERLTAAGFAVRRYIGFFGHPYYARVKPILLAHEALSDWLVRHPAPAFTSYALAVLERVDDSVESSPSRGPGGADTLASTSRKPAPAWQHNDRGLVVGASGSRRGCSVPPAAGPPCEPPT